MLAALVSGVLFGFGLSWSGMLDPLRVRGFLDLFGAWNPSLIFVLGGAVAIAMAGVAIMRRLPRPAFDQAFHVPIASRIDSQLIFGSAIFGIGWGMAGFCPGPAVTSLILGVPAVALFVVAMLAGMVIHDRFVTRTANARAMGEGARGHPIA